MLKEIVRFSEELEKNGIYDLIKRQKELIDKPIFVLPVKEDLSDFEQNKSYFVVYKKDGNKIILQDSKNHEKIIEYKSNNDENIKIFSIQEIEQMDIDWANILKINGYLNSKFINDKKGGKSIGSNKGTNSYHILTFIGKFEKGEQKINKYTGDIFYNQYGFNYKMEKTYGKSENIAKGIPKDFSEKDKMINLLNKLKEEQLLLKIWNYINSFKNIFKDKKDEKIKGFKNIVFFIKLPTNYYNQYEIWYEHYLEKKIFAKDEPKKYKNDFCPICGKEEKLYMLNDFNNLNEKKLFIKHRNRYIEENIYICQKCAYKIYKFHQLFLGDLGITTFPLFINENYNEKSIKLLKRKDDKIVKIGFQKIIENIFNEYNNDELDFYLIIYKKVNKELVFLDYITGFKLYFNGYHIYNDIKLKLNNLFDRKLVNNFFENKGIRYNSNLQKMIYKYRTLVFDFLYRAKYNSLNKNIISNIFYDYLKRKLKKFYKENVKVNYYDFIELNKIFKGDVMQNIELIKNFLEKLLKNFEENDDVREIYKDLNLKNNEKIRLIFYFIAGQIVYYLLTQSETGEKTHAMVEPFINISNSEILINRIIEVFEKYKHKINLTSKKFNLFFAFLIEIYIKNKDTLKQFRKNEKIYFYLGYFDDNIFYKSNGGKNER